MNYRLGANVFYMILWQAGNYIIPLFTFPYLAHVLGIHGFGEFGLSFAWVAYLVLITDWGFQLSASGEIAQASAEGAEISTIFWNVIGAKALLASICLLLLAGATITFPAAHTMAPTLLAAGGMVISNILTVNWCLQGLERLGSFAAASTFGRLMTIPATFLFVQGPGDVWLAAAIQSAGASIGGIASLIFLYRLNVIARPQITARGVIEQLSRSWSIFVSQAAVNLYSTTNTIVIGLFGGPADVGIYAAADRIRAAAQGALQPISQAVYPHSNRLMALDRAAGMRFAKRLLIAQGLFAACISAVLYVEAPLIISILAGPQFTESVPVLRILALVPFLVGLSNVFGVQIMLPLGLKSRFSSILVRAALINLTLVLTLVWFFGRQGAAIATVTAELYITAAMISALIELKINLFPARLQNEG